MKNYDPFELYQHRFSISPKFRHIAGNNFRLKQMVAVGSSAAERKGSTMAASVLYPWNCHFCSIFNVQGYCRVFIRKNRASYPSFGGSTAFHFFIHWWNQRSAQGRICGGREGASWRFFGAWASRGLFWSVVSRFSWFLTLWHPFHIKGGFAFHAREAKVQTGGGGNLRIPADGGCLLFPTGSTGNELF